MAAPDILKKILSHKRQEVSKQQQQVPLAKLQSAIKTMPPTRDFIAAIEAKIQQQQPAVIAEIKKASPSKGIIRKNFDPVSIAHQYEQAGAACISVLTDEKFFQGSNDYLQQVKAHCQLPVLRKDFIIEPYQVYQARYIGADCLLLIVAALSDEQLKTLASLAKELNLAVLVEVHNKQELHRALQLQTKLIGINNRDLKTFTTSLDNTLNLLSDIPSDRIVVTESGIYSHNDVEQMRQHHVNVFLVGEVFMRASQPGEALRNLFFLTKI